MIPRTDLTYTPLSRKRYRCNQSGAIVKEARVKGHRRSNGGRFKFSQPPRASKSQKRKARNRRHH